MNIKESQSGEKKQKRKEQLKQQKIKKSRLIIRNLSFNATEDEIRKQFAQFGNIVEINLPKKENGSHRGFAFVSFDNIGSSLKAIKHLNGKEILKRAVAVDFSLPKSAFSQLQANKDQTTKQSSKVDNDDFSKKPANDEESDNDDDIESDDSGEKVNGDEEDIDEEEEEEVEDEDEVSNSSSKKSRKPSDVLEERTVFIRNLDLDTTEESLAELLSTFGPLEYCKICINRYTEKSRGTAFAKFKCKADADKCLAEESLPDNPKLYIDGQRISVTLAVPRNKLIEIENAKHNKHKDKRNLYLAKEGLIYPNSPAAVGVSQADLKKRLQLEELKRKKLQNYHNFISDTRLCIHNLPPSVDDKKLRQIFIEAAKDKKAQILWAKVMCNRSRTDKKLGTSKGFGFVEFSEHSHALNALRYLNNNPSIFTAEKRPIVEFSVENKVALNRKKYRVIKQQKIKLETENSSSTNQIAKTSKGSKRKPVKSEINTDAEEPNYSGVMTKPLAKDDKVIQPKVNRKIGQVKGDLKKRNKELKAEKKKQVNAQRHQQKLKKRQERQEELRQKRDAEEAEKFDAHFIKRKRAFVADQEHATAVTALPKRTKWYVK